MKIIILILCTFYLGWKLGYHYGWDAGEWDTTNMYESMDDGVNANRAIP